MRCLLFEGLKSRTGLEKYNAAPRVNVRATAAYVELFDPWLPCVGSSDSLGILVHQPRAHGSWVQVQSAPVARYGTSTN